MRLHRLFIAINLPDETKEQLLAYKKQWADLPAKWTIKDNLHITLAFLGNRSDKELEKTYELVQKVGERHKPFSVKLNKISYGPSENTPKMIWAVGERSPELIDLQQDIVKSLGSENNPLTSLRASTSFLPHLTLAKLSTFNFQQTELEELPQIHEEISLSFNVNSIEIMKSEPKRSNAQYTMLKSILL